MNISEIYTSFIFIVETLLFIVERCRVFFNRLVILAEINTFSKFALINMRNSNHGYLKCWSLSIYQQFLIEID